MRPPSPRYLLQQGVLLLQKKAAIEMKYAALGILKKVDGVWAEGGRGGKQGGNMGTGAPEPARTDNKPQPDGRPSSFTTAMAKWRLRLC